MNKLPYPRIFPTDKRMELVYSACYSINNQEYADIITLICEKDLDLDNLAKPEYTELLLTIAKAIDIFLPEQCGDHRILNIIKDFIEKNIPNYKCIRNFDISHEVS